MWRRHLATWAVVTVIALLVNVPQASAYGSSITSPGAAAAVGVSPAEWTAFLAGHAELTGASVASPIASAVATAGVATAGAAVVSADGLGGITGLLGGIHDWFFGAPEVGAPGLPSGSAGGWFGQLYLRPVDGIDYGVALQFPPVITQTSAASATIAWPGTSGLVQRTAGVYCSGSSPHSYVSGLYALTTALWSNGGSSFLGSKSQSFTCPSGTLAYVRTWENPTTVGLPNKEASYAFATAVTPDNPVRHIEQTVTCKNAAGVVTTVTSSTTAAPMTAGELIEVAGIMCPLGERAVGVTATVVTEGGDDLVVVDQPYAPGEGWDEITEDIPEPCYSGTTCHLELERVTDPSGDDWEVVDPATVPYWWSDPVRDSVYRCRYGSGSSWVQLPITACQVYSDPTEDELAQPDGPAPDTDPSGDCSFGWGDLLNGGIFVRGSKCVLRWAFIPEAGFAPVMGRFSSGWSGSGIGAWVSETGGAGSAMGSQLAAAGSVGCAGPTYAVAIGDFDGQLRPFSTCSEPFQTIAPIVKALLGMLLVFAGVRSILRRITRATDMPNAPGA